jgi:hypothetical protein
MAGRWAAYKLFFIVLQLEIEMFTNEKGKVVADFHTELKGQEKLIYDIPEAVREF